MSNFDLRTRMAEKLEIAWEFRAMGNEVPPTWYIYGPGQVDYSNSLMIVTPWPNEDAKRAAVNLVAEFVREAQPRPIAFIFVTDAWYRTMPADEPLDRPVHEYWDSCEVIQVVGYTATEGLMMHRPYRRRDDGVFEVTGPDWSEDQLFCSGMTDRVVNALRGFND